MTRTIAILTPILDDWVSFAVLVEEISNLFTGSDFDFHVYAIDDGSSMPFDADSIPLPEASCILTIEVIRLAANLGHQRAIAAGLCAVAESTAVDAVLVMDGDGQDRPVDIAPLLAAGFRHPHHVVVAKRAKRSESYVFRLGYGAYRFLFYALTGQPINFGNFCLIPIAAVRRLVHMPELWNNLAASITRSRLAFTMVPTTRGGRFAGRSRMNLVSLILHGLTAISVYTDTIFVRTLIAAAFVAATAGFGITVVVAIRVATDLAIPGWATVVAGDLLIILLQTLVIVVAVTLTFLAGRSHRPFVPIVDCPAFVAHRERCRLRRQMVASGRAVPAE